MVGREIVSGWMDVIGELWRQSGARVVAVKCGSRGFLFKYSKLLNVRNGMGRPYQGKGMAWSEV